MMRPIRVLTLHVKRKYYEQIRCRLKREEYRLVTDHWSKRIGDRHFDYVQICLGYPKAGDKTRRIWFRWDGYTRKRIKHEHFGEEHVEVFAIKLWHRVKPPTDNLCH